jgi:hypothetical protein
MDCGGTPPLWLHCRRLDTDGITAACNQSGDMSPQSKMAITALNKSASSIKDGHTVPKLKSPFRGTGFVN